jgi:pyruvate dehydrogenase E2 component (dihydrolipoamide acetyltransferase)
MPAAMAGEADAVLTAWLVAEGGAVTAQDPVATVETAKAAFDVPAGADGVLLRRLVAEGAEVAAGTPIAVTGTAAETDGDAEALLRRLGIMNGGAEKAGLAEGGAAAGDAPEGGTPGSGAPANGGTPEGAVAGTSAAAGTSGAIGMSGAAGTSGVVGTSVAAGTSGADRTGNGRIFISPIARRLAREAGLPYRDITGTGPNGRIIRRDVEAAIARQTAPAPAPALPAPALPAPAPPAPAPAPAAPAEAARATPAPAAPATSGAGDSDGQGPGWTDIPHSRQRRAIAARLTESKQTIPHFYLRATPDVRKLVKLARRLNAAGPPRITLTHLLVKAAAHAHLEVPAMNVIWTPDAVRSYATVDLSVAIATDHGLVAPVIRSAEQLPVSRIAAILADLAARARDGRLRPDELAGGTATITNLGMHGTEEFAAIINPPQSAILAVGALREAPVVRHGEVRPGQLMTVTLATDHRPVDGVTAARWLRAFTALLEDPVRILR